MVELAVWYDQDEDQDELIIRTVDELNALVDRVLAETKDHRCPAAIQVGIRGIEGYPVLEVGLGQERGFIQYHAEDGRSTKGDGDPDAYVEYVYMGKSERSGRGCRGGHPDVAAGVGGVLPDGSAAWGG